MMADYAGVDLADKTGTIATPVVVGSLALVHGLVHMVFDHDVQPDDLAADKPVLLGNSISTLIRSSWPDRKAGV